MAGRKEGLMDGWLDKQASRQVNACQVRVVVHPCHCKVHM